MAKKRGGLAGFYDRNKGLVRTAATIGGSLLGGPAAGAAIGAAFRGLDREGQRGIGLDVSQALRGGLEGYGIGKGTQAVAGGVRGLLTAQKLNALGPVDMASKIGITPGTSLPSANMAGNIGLTGGMGATPPGMPTSLPSFMQAQSSPFANVMSEGAKTAQSNMARQAAAAARTSVPSGPVGPLASPAGGSSGGFNLTPDLETINRSMGAMPKPDPAAALEQKPGPFGRFVGAARKNKDLIEMAGKGIQQGLAMGRVSPTEEANMMKAETERMAFEDEKAQREARQRALQQYFMPLLGQIQQERQGMSFGPMYRG